MVPGEGCPYIPSATVGSVGRHLAGSLAWDATLAAAHCLSAPPDSPDSCEQPQVQLS